MKGGVGGCCEGAAVKDHALLSGQQAGNTHPTGMLLLKMISGHQYRLAK